MPDIIENDYECDNVPNVGRDCDNVPGCTGYWNIGPSGDVPCLPDNITVDEENGLVIGATDEQIAGLQSQSTRNGWWTLFANIKMLWWKINWLLCNVHPPQSVAVQTVGNETYGEASTDYDLNKAQWDLIVGNTTYEQFSIAAPDEAEFADLYLITRVGIAGVRENQDVTSAPDGIVRMQADISLPILGVGVTASFKGVAGSDYNYVYVPMVPVVDGKIDVEARIQSESLTGHIAAGFFANAIIQKIRWYN